MRQPLTKRAWKIDGEIHEESRIRTTPAAVRRYFAGREPARVVLEVGTQSSWLSRLLEKLGHDVIIANPRRLRLITENERKSDKVDAELLARLGRVDVKLLSPIHHRSEFAQTALAVLRARHGLSLHLVDVLDAAAAEEVVVDVAHDVRRFVVAALVSKTFTRPLIERRSLSREIRRAASESPPKGVTGAGSMTNSTGGGS